MKKLALSLSTLAVAGGLATATILNQKPTEQINNEVEVVMEQQEEIKEVEQVETVEVAETPVVSEPEVEPEQVAEPEKCSIIETFGTDNFDEAVFKFSPKLKNIYLRSGITPTDIEKIAGYENRELFTWFANKYAGKDDTNYVINTRNVLNQEIQPIRRIFNICE